METTFGDWLLAEINKRNISQAELSRLSNVTAAQISRVINGSRGAGDAALIAIARALHLPAEEVFRHAGLLPPVPELDRLQEKMLYLFNTLTDPGDKQRAIEFIEFIKSKEDEQIKGKTVST